MNQPDDTKAALRKAATVIQALERRLAATELARSEPIAIIGTGCRLPGGVDDLAGFAALLRAGVDTVGPIPRGRFDVDRLYNPDPDVAGTMYVRQAACLERIDGFDAAYFGLSAREAAWLDPQHRLVLECAWEALDDAGAPPDRLRDAQVGVYVGIGPCDYGARLGNAPETLEAYTATGIGQCFAAGRLSYLLGLHGPSLAVDTACSSSLVALHLACQALRAGDCDLAIAGGVLVMLSPELFVLLSRLRALAPDGRSKSFSASADGYGRGEGCGMVVVKRLSHALRDGDRVLAVIRGSAINHDGPSSGLTAPNGTAQRDVIRRALASAGLAPADVDYVEAHGTGTPLGDPIEIEALAAAYGPDRVEPLRVGAVKSNIGHLESASGIAGVLKVIASLRGQMIPPSLHAEQLNPTVEWSELPVRVVRSLEPWPAGERPRRAGVSSFGMSGTNAHVVLEEAPPVSAAAAAAAAPRRDALELVTLSATTATALSAVAGRLRAQLDARPDLALADLAFSAATTRTHHPHRAAIVTATRDGLAAALAAAARGEAPAPGARGDGRVRRGKLAFLFAGQGTQRLGMGRPLHATWPAFAAAWDRCCALFDAAGSPGTRPLRDVVWAEPASPDAALLDETAYTQPALFALEWALCELWRSWGIEPDLVAGHSIGELVAACVANVVSLDDAVTLVAARARLMQALPTGGAMLAVAGPHDEVARAVAAVEDVEIAAVNAPDAIVISGGERAVLAVGRELAARGMRSTRLPVSHAFHSRRMTPMLAELERVAATLELRAPDRPMASNVSGAIAGAEVATPSYWAHHVRSTVRFADDLRALAEQGVATFIEIGPRPTLLTLVSACLGETDAVLVPSLRTDRCEPEAVLEALASWYARGGAVDWRGVFPHGGRRVELPAYAYERKRHWIELAPRAAGISGSPGRWPLSGMQVRSPDTAWHHVVAVGPNRPAFVADHVVFDRVVIAGAFHVAVALAVAAEHWPGRALELTGVEFVRAKPFDGDGELELHVVLTPDGVERDARRFEIATADGDDAWTTHVRGRVAPTSAQPGGALERLASEATAPVDPAQMFARLSAMQIDWGARWRWVIDARTGPDVSVATLAPTYPGAHGVAPLHPALIDNAFAASLLASLLTPGDGSPRLPFAVDRLRWWRAPVGALRSIGAPQRGADVADFALVDDDGVVAEVCGLACRAAPLARLLPAAAAGSLDDAFIEPSWIEQPVPLARVASGRWWIIGGGAVGGALEAALVAAGHRAVQTSAVVAPMFGGAAASAVVHLGSLDAGEGFGAAGLEAALAAGCDSALATVQQLVAWDEPPRLWLVTRGAHAVGGGELALTQSPMIGLGRAIAAEHAELRCTRIDLDPGRPAGELSALVAELVADGAERELALRGDRRHVARLVRRVPEASGGRQLAIRGDASYLVTGGLGGLGLSVADWLASRGAGHVVLVGRSGATSAAQTAAIAAIESRGTRVSVACADVANRRDVERALELAGPALRGVIHAAGLVDDGLVIHQTPARLRAVMAPKVWGALHLHELTRRLPLDFFVLYSSGAGLLGSPGQSNYAAANTFLDALAHHRQRYGLPALAIDWGAFAEVGMAATRDDRAARLADLGMRSLTPAEGLIALERLVLAARTQVGVIPLDIRRWRDAAPAIAGSPMLSLLAETERSPESRAPARGSGISAARDPRDPMDDSGGELRARLIAASPGERPALVRDLVRAAVGRVLRSPGAELDDSRELAALGMDSLLGLELRNRLAAALQLALPATLIFQHPTIDAIVEHVVDAVRRAVLAFDITGPDDEEGTL